MAILNDTIVRGNLFLKNDEFKFLGTNQKINLIRFLNNKIYLGEQNTIIKIESSCEIDGKLTVDNLTTLDSLDCGNATFNGEVKFLNDLTLDKNLIVNGTSTFNGNVIFANDLTLDKNLTVKGDTSLNTLTCSGSATLDNLTVINQSTLNTLTCSGKTVLNNTLSVSNDTSLTKLICSDSASFNKDIIVTGESNFNNNLNINGKIILSVGYGTDDPTWTGKVGELYFKIVGEEK